jgi:chromosome segregation ATPase
MTNSEGSGSGDRLDRIEAALERIGQQLDSQVEVNASLRTSVEVLNNSAETLKLGLEETRASIEALLQIATIHQDDINVLAESIRQHRSDGHGA